MILSDIVLAFALLGDETGTFPERVGLVNDFAGALPAPVKEKVDSAVRALRDEHQYVLVVVTVKSLHGMSIEDYSNKLANRWGIGRKKEDNGVVFLVAPAEKKVRIEVGYGVEARLTDIESKMVIEEIVLPRFKEAKIAEGIEAGTRAIAARLGGGQIPEDLVRKKEAVPQAAVIIVVIVIVFVILVIIVAAGGGSAAVATIFSDSGGGSWGGGGGSSDGGGGGGSFGGGGASGSW